METFVALRCMPPNALRRTSCFWSVIRVCFLTGTAFLRRLNLHLGTSHSDRLHQNGSRDLLSIDHNGSRFDLRLACA
jgi:hypothetical protein